MYINNLLNYKVKLEFYIKAEILEGADAWELDTGVSSEGHHENLMDKDKFSKLN